MPPPETVDDMAAATPEISEKPRESETTSGDNDGGITPPEEQGIWGEGGSVKDYIVSGESLGTLYMLGTTRMAPDSL